MLASAGLATRDDRLRAAAAAAVVAGSLCAVASLGMHVIAEQRSSTVEPYAWSSLVFAVTWSFAGLVVVRANPRNRAGWLLVSTAWIGLYQLLGEYTIWNARVSDLPLHAVTDWTSTWGFALYLYVLPLVPLLFPDGRLPSPRWRWFAASLVVSATALTVIRMFAPAGTDIDASVPNPLGVPVLEPLFYVAIACAFYNNAVGLLVGVVALVLRTRRAVGVERTQLQWLLLGGVFLLVGVFVSATPVRYGDVAFTIGTVGPPLAIAVAIVRHRLFDVDLVLGRSLVFLAVLALVVAGGTAVLLQLDPELAGTRRGVLLVAGLAVAAVLTRSAVQALVDRWWFPERQDAATLGRRIAEAVGEAAEPREALADLVAAVRGTLRLPYVGFRGDVVPVEAASGERPAHVVTLDAAAMGRQVGVLEVAPRREGEGFARAERVALEESASRAAMLAYAARLVADVEESRASIVAAREEERRRLRNDLHDGVGPTLAAIALQADLLARRLEGAGGGPDGALGVDAERAAGIREGLRAAVADVRAVSHGLRPPILDQIGLSAALRQLVAGLEPVAGSAVVDELDDVPAAVEVALFAVAAEAVGNVVRHSAASRVRLDAVRDGDRVAVRVSDNGRGMPASPRAGVGLSSMRQRMAEVGGNLDHRPAPGGGTVVSLSVPLRPGSPGPARPASAQPASAQRTRNRSTREDDAATSGEPR